MNLKNIRKNIVPYLFFIIFSLYLFQISSHIFIIPKILQYKKIDVINNPNIPPYIPVEYSHPKKQLTGIDNNIPGLIPDNGHITIGEDLGLNNTILSLYD